AVDWALALEKIASNVTIVHRRDRFRAHEYSVKQMMDSSINVFTPFVPTELLEGSKLESIKLKHTKNKEVIELKANEYIVNYGFISNLGPINNWGLAITNKSCLTNSTAQTDIPGMYAVGDISTYPGRVELMATGFGEAPIAVRNARIYIDPDESVQIAHSTSIMGSS